MPTWSKGDNMVVAPQPTAPIQDEDTRTPETAWHTETTDKTAHSLRQHLLMHSSGSSRLIPLASTLIAAWKKTVQTYTGTEQLQLLQHNKSHPLSTNRPLPQRQHWVTTRNAQGPFPAHQQDQKPSSNHCMHRHQPHASFPQPAHPNWS